MKPLRKGGGKLLRGGDGSGEGFGFGGDGGPVFFFEGFGVHQRAAGGRGEGAGFEELADVVLIHAAGGDEFDVGERGFDGLDVGGAEKFGGENLHGVGAGFPGGDDLGGRERATENRHAVTFAHRDDVGARGGGDDELGPGENAGACRLCVEDGAEAEEEIGQLRCGFLQHADGAGGGHGQLDASEPAFSEGLRAIEEAVGAVCADQGDDFFRLNLGENGVFFHGSGGCRRGPIGWKPIFRAERRAGARRAWRRGKVGADPRHTLMTAAFSKAPSVPVARTLVCRGRALALGAQPLIMGILNVTPDSFFDGGEHATLESGVARAVEMVAEGAAVIDVGGQSTRPGFKEVSAEEEIARVVPAITALAVRLEVPLSIDTYKPAVARAALTAGAHILNDIHGLQRDPELALLAAEFGCAVVIMHNDERFPTAGGDVIARMSAWLDRSLEIAARAGVAKDRIVLDPGIGFFKTPQQNLEIMGRLGELRALGYPLLLGASRKSTIGHVLDGLPVEERLEGTLATTALAVWQGVDLVRVHDVQENVRAARVAWAIREQAMGNFRTP